ncbi:hypothetical protein [Nocardioides sp. B-3]|uniref:hypothetical protein n=1 Tax=Nocardioides sp. B-3 TaxID=2895565 RepID=UPI0021530BCA|nr:hypothetical protein [Nocardioides sp. B-3]UUZ59285.1 hypothetical protein LP418_26055 [Nocardioides sp. B-3]
MPSRRSPPAVTPVFSAIPAGDSSPGECADEHTSGARVAKGAKAQEPALYPAAKAGEFAQLADAAQLAPGSVTVDTVFHVISDHTLTRQELRRTNTMVEDQMQVLNDAYAGLTAPDAADTPFRFNLGRDDLHGQRRVVHGHPRSGGDRHEVRPARG